MVAAFDEMKGHNGGVRPACSELSLEEVPPDVLEYRRREAELIFRRIGITLAVYGEANAQERLTPLSITQLSMRSIPSSKTSMARAKFFAQATRAATNGDTLMLLHAPACS